MRKIKRLVLQITIAFLLVEFILFIMGFKCGKTSYSGVDNIDCIVQQPNLYINDSNGIYKINTNNLLVNSDLMSIEGVGGIYEDSKKYIKSLNSKEINHELMPVIFKYLAESTNPSDSIIKKYLTNPINTDGFRSIDFKAKTDSSRKKVLIIGDSFAWGMSASSFFNSFSDILLTKNYWVYNTGISGVDPAQYLGVLQQYLPLIKPDLVIVNFYEGNDFTPILRELDVNKPIEYYTNEGFLANYPDGNSYTFNNLKNYYQKIDRIPQTAIINKVFSQTRITTILWSLLVNMQVIDDDFRHTYYTYQNKSKLECAFIVKPAIEKMQAICLEDNTPICFVVVPEVRFSLFKKNTYINNGKNKAALDVVFENTNYYFPSNFTGKDYADGGHFNDLGHKKYANYLDSIVDFKLSKNIY